MISDLQLIHITVETILAGLVWLLYRRQDAARRRMTALETEHGLMKKRFEAATAGLHMRLLQVEKQCKRSEAALPWGVGKPPRVLPLPAGKTRGEMDLLMKIRQLNQ